MRLRWDDKDPHKLDWDGGILWWRHLEDFSVGDLTALIAKEGNILAGPEEFGFDVDAEGRLWVAYRAKDGDVWLGESNATLDTWLSHRRLVYAPSGSTNPTLAIDQDNHYVLGVELKPSGVEQKEIHLHQYPHGEGDLRKIDNGQYPLLLGSLDEAVLFYQSANKEQILVRTSKNNFASAAAIPFEELSGAYPIAARLLIHSVKPPIYYEYQYILFCQKDSEIIYALSERMPWYMPVEIKAQKSAGLEMGVESIFWQPIYTIEVFAEKTSGVEMGVESITWVFVSKPEVLVGKTAGIEMGVESIDWQQVYKYDVEIEKRVGLNMGVESILWTEVD